jgi:hypothetical protein
MGLQYSAENKQLSDDPDGLHIFEGSGLIEDPGYVIEDGKLTRFTGEDRE